MPTRSIDPHHRQAPAPPTAVVGPARLSAAVPDVAMAPNANTHLLTARDYFRLTPWEYSSGGVLQLDLGDGATHTPRPGSRAARAGASQSSRPSREHAQAMSCLRSRADDDELRAAIELSVMRAYSSFGSRAVSGAVNGGHGGAAPWRGAATLPPARDPSDIQLAPTHVPAGVRSRASASPPGVAGAGRQPDLHTPPPHVALSRMSGGSRSPSTSPGASPRRPRGDHGAQYARHDYRLEAPYGSGSGSGSGSRGHSPNTYA